MSVEERNFYNAISLSYAIGDFIAFESFLTNTEKINLKEIICLGGKKPILDLMRKSIFYDIKKTKITFLDRPEIDNFEERYKILNNYISNKLNGKKYRILIDHNFYDNNVKYKLLLKNHNIKNYSFVKEKLTSINRFTLPEKYIAISAWSLQDKEKEFNINDWEETFKILKKYDVKGVILNNQTWYCKNSWYEKLISKNKSIIDLTGKTTFYEAIEIIKNARGFLGIDGCLSIIATQALRENSILIKAKKNAGAIKRFDYFYSNLKNINKISQEINSSKFNIINI